MGRNAFAHEAGIHQDGMLKNQETYEIMRPQDVGVPETHLVLGKHSGRHAFRDRLQTLGFTVDEVRLEHLFSQFKHLADRKKHVYDEDIEALVLGNDQQGPWYLDSLAIHTEIVDTEQSAKAELFMRYLNKPSRLFTGRGDGPINAIVNAMRQTLNEPLQLEDFQIKNVSIGSDAQGQAIVRAKIGDYRFQGTGLSTDIVEASAQALVNVINRHCQASNGQMRARHRALSAI